MRSEDKQLRARIIEEIQRVTKANGGKPPGVRVFERESAIKQSSWLGVIWSKWADAVLEAGYTPNILQQKSDPSFLLMKLCEASQHFKRIPSVAELRIYHRNIDPEFPSHTTFNLNFGSKAETLDRMSEWIGDKPEYADVRAMLPAQESAPTSAAKKSSKADGFVYLIKSGKHFKIGKSNDIERRIKEIRVALPEASVLEHVITTDDPSGIEKYWHSRFANRRANGEWFSLMPQDILAFKRRKFQ